jgi:small subunit ribosomal protein S8
MVMSDPVADMLTRIRNGQMAKLSRVSCQASKHKENILEVLLREGYIRAYKRVEVRPGIYDLEIDLKYYEGQPVIGMVKKLSKPGRRTYSHVDTLPKIHNGLGVAIISTSKGLMTDAEARTANLGGEVICQLF